jgi:cyanophycinase
MTVVCLQGGAEMQPPCAEMDRHLLELAPSDVVVVVPLAGAPGMEYDQAGRRGIDHFSSLGADVVVVAPDARTDEAGAVAAIASAGLVFLPGGSPSRLRDALVGTPVGEAVTAAHRRGAVVAGASAGAMVLCERVLLPDRRLAVADGLALAPGLLVVPHYDPGRAEWRAAGLRGAGDDLTVLGLPECSGVLVAGDTLTAVGVAASVLIEAEGDRELALHVEPEA